MNSAATISPGEESAVCADSTASDCLVTVWMITPNDSTTPTYLTYDEATNPTQITELWLRCGRQEGGKT